MEANVQVSHLQHVYLIFIMITNHNIVDFHLKLHRKYQYQYRLELKLFGSAFARLKHAKQVFKTLNPSFINFLKVLISSIF